MRIENTYKKKNTSNKHQSSYCAALQLLSHTHTMVVGIGYLGEQTFEAHIAERSRDSRHESTLLLVQPMALIYFWYGWLGWIGTFYGIKNVLLKKSASSFF